MLPAASRPPLAPPSAAQAASGDLLVPVLFAVLMLAAAAPLLAAPVAPLADYVNHLARMHVIAALDGDAILQRVYTVDWQAVPNLAMDLLVPPLARHLDLYLAGRLFLVAVVLVLAGGPLALHHALYGRLSPWPLVAAPLVYNGIFLFGFVNYLLGIGVGLWGVALWIVLRERPAPLRAVASAVVVVALFFCHLFAVGLYGLALLAVEAERLRRPPAARPAFTPGDAAAFALPFLPALGLLALSPTLGLATEVVWEGAGKLEGLLYAVSTYGGPGDAAVLGGLAGGGVWAARRGWLRLHPAGLVLLVIGAAVYLAMPRMLFGSWLADQRLPVALLFLLVGFARLDLPDRAARYGFCALLLAVSAVRFGDVAVVWRSLDADAAELRRSVTLLDGGARVLVAHADARGDGPADDALTHMPCVAVIERSALVSTLFSVPGKQVLGVRPDHRGLVDAADGDPPAAGRLAAASEEPGSDGGAYWELWPERYDDVYVLFTRPGDANPDPDHLTLLHDGARFQLYRTVPAGR